MLDLKIQGGTIVDGSGSPRYLGDVGVKDGRIVALGSIDEDARETIDATGKIVAPGFVDIHTHYDAQVFWDPTLSPSSVHGVTTVIGGFCGFSIAPLSEESASYVMPMLARVEGMPLQSLATGVPWNWNTFAEYLSRIEGSLAINAGFLAGHSTIRRYVMGPRAGKDRATPDDLARMKDVLRECLRGGALGFSTSLSTSHNDAEGNPVPSRHASQEEVLELFSVISEFEGTMAELLPNGNFTEETYEILTGASLAARRPVNWNVLVITNLRAEEVKLNQNKLRASDHARERGANVVALTLPYAASVYINFASGFNLDAIPGWAPLFKLPIPQRMEKLRDPQYRAELKAGAATVTGTRKISADYTTFKVVEVFSDKNVRYKDRIIREVAADEKRDAFDVFVDIALADNLETVFSPQYAEESAEIFRARAELWNDQRAVIGGSDAGAHLDMINSFAIPTVVLASAVRNFGVISLEQAVHQLTLKPASLVGLRERGALKPGWHADIVVFDETKVGPGREYMRQDLPAGGKRLYAEAHGISHVIVNGREVLREGNYLGTPAGKILRSGKDTYTVEIPLHKIHSA